MNVVIRKHYPASRLPKDLREGFPEDGVVDIQIVGSSNTRLSLSELLGSGRNIHGDDEAVLDHLAKLRADR